ncbi:MAG: M3 family metallopeptidase, partial [Muribaculaceae bacterium]|nr:M3 family metallopeptidase [Muribaculaceae bacterium]
MKKYIISGLAALAIMTVNTVNSSAQSTPRLLDAGLAYGALPFDRLTASDYEQAVKDGIERRNQNIAAIVNQRSVPTFENTIVALHRSGDDLGRAELALGNLEHALGDTLLMQALANVTPLISSHEAEVILNEPLWERIKQVYDNRDKRNDLTKEDLRLLDETYMQFALNGANLQGADREKYRELNAKLSDLNLKFAQNVTNEMASADRRLWLTADDLSGLPEDIKNAARQEAKQILESEGKEDDGTSYVFTVYFPSFSPFIKYSDRRDLREKMYRLYNSRNQKGEFSNIQVLKDIANTRLELAKLMGKKNFAEYTLQHTMAGNPANVYAMFTELTDAYLPAMKEELAVIEEYARSKEGADYVMMPWDYTYWADKYKNEKYAFNDEDMKPYFELNNTIKGVFGLATKLYGYTFKENTSLPGYHPDVKVYEVYNRDGKMIGLLYTDFFYRAGKSPGAWMTEYQTECKDDDGNKTYPIISIVCNFAKPVGDNPVLLNPYEVETFLHEFGHALHGLSAEAKYTSLSGTNVYHDFVELFSQFNENYLTEKEFLDSFAVHYKTGEKMPEELLEKFIQASQYGAAYACIRQLNFGITDMAYHTIEEPLSDDTDIEMFENVAITPVRIFAPVEGTYFSPPFSHVFAGGYAAG